jgi:toxin ParE1/3/4
VTSRPRYSAAARDDLREIAGFIGQDNPARARSFVKEPRSRCRRVAADPRVHRSREELGPGVRAAMHGAYLILYTHRDDGQVVIERVVHGARPRAVAGRLTRRGGERRPGRAAPSPSRRPPPNSGP